SGQMHLVLLATSSGYVQEGWRARSAQPARIVSFDYFVEMARICESAKFDAMFWGDQVVFGQTRHCPYDALTLATVLTAATGRLGQIATGSTTFYPPYMLARQLASIDQLSGGRAGWNIVTSYHPGEMANFGISDVPTHASRYERAEEFMQVVKGLW